MRIFSPLIPSVPLHDPTLDPISSRLSCTWPCERAGLGETMIARNVHKLRSTSVHGHTESERGNGVSRRSDESCPRSTYGAHNAIARCYTVRTHGCGAFCDTHVSRVGCILSFHHLYVYASSPSKHVPLPGNRAHYSRLCSWIFAYTRNSIAFPWFWQKKRCRPKHIQYLKCIKIYVW